MSDRKPISERLGKFASTRAEIIRRKQEAHAFELGVPLCPDKHIANRRPLYALWKKNVELLYGRRLLAFSDGDARNLKGCWPTLSRTAPILKGTTVRPAN